MDEIITLERITVKGFTVDKEYVECVYYDNKLYCIDDELKEGVDVKVVDRVDTIDEVYKRYIEANLRNTVNPYALLLLYKEKKEILSKLNGVAFEILDRNIKISNELLERLNTHLLSLEKKGKPISITLSVLDAISIIDSIYIEEKKLPMEEILRVIDELVDITNNAIYYPTPIAIRSYIEALFEEVKEEEERIKERIEENIKEKVKDVTVSLYTPNEKREVPISLGERVLVTNKVDGESVILEESEGREEEGIITKILLFKYPTKAEKYLQRVIESLIKQLRRYGINIEIK